MENMCPVSWVAVLMVRSRQRRKASSPASGSPGRDEVAVPSRRLGDALNAAIKWSTRAQSRNGGWFYYASKDTFNPLVRNDYSGGNGWLKVLPVRESGQRGAFGARVELAELLRWRALAALWRETEEGRTEAAELARRSGAPVTGRGAEIADGRGALRIACRLHLGPHADGAVVVEVEAPLERQVAIIELLKWGEAWLNLALRQLGETESLHLPERRL